MKYQALYGTPIQKYFCEKEKGVWKNISLLKYLWYKYIRDIEVRIIK